MKKILILILSLVLGTQAFGQVYVDAGYVQSKINYKGFYNTTNMTGVNLNGNGGFLGIGTDIKLPGLSQLTLSPSFRFNITNYDLYDVNLVEYFLNVPVHIKYMHPIDKGAEIFISAGPSILYSLGGRQKDHYLGDIYRSKALDGGDFDIQLGIEGGVSIIENLRFICGYDFGLLNQTREIKLKATRNTFHLGIGYIF
jgi:hypothetical protein